MFLPTLVPRRRHKTRPAETPMVLPAMRLLLLVLCSVIPVAAGAQTQSPREPPPTPRRLAIANKPWTGDFDKLLERRMIRVYAPFSRSLYFSDKGRERGLAVELVRDWERYLNLKYAKQLGNRPLTKYYVAYRLTLDAQAEVEKAKQQMVAPKS